MHICNEGKWACFDGRRCIIRKNVCDGLLHCTDGSDEKSEVCSSWECPMGRWKCKNDKCIDDTVVCNGYGNCNDGSDEEDKVCTEWKCVKDRPTNINTTSVPRRVLAGIDPH